jgi:hypothetical protein
MSVLDRKLFNRGGGVSSRGVGITSGLVDQPVQRFDNGGEVTFPSLMDQRLELLKSLDLGRPEVISKQEAAAPALLALSGALLSGRSFQGGLGGALDVVGQALTKTSPDVQQAVQRIAQSEQAQINFDNQLKLKAFDLAYDEYSKSLDDKFKAADLQTLYSKTNPGETLTVNLNDKTSAIYTDPNFLEKYSTDKPAEFKAAKLETFYNIKDNTAITVDLNNPKSVFYKDLEFRKNFTTDKPEGFKQGKPTTFFKRENMNESIVVDLANPDSVYYTDQENFLKEYTLEKPKPAKEDTVYYTKIGTTDETPMSERFGQVRRKVENGVTTYFVDDEEISEKRFLEDVGRDIMTEKPLGYSPTIAASEDRLIDTREKLKQRYSSMYPGETLTPAELDSLIMDFADNSGNLRDFVKTIDGVTINELEGAMFDIHKKKENSAENKIAKNDIDKVTKGDSDAIDLYYDLDPNDPNYEQKKQLAKEKYADRPAISEDDMRGINAAILGLQDLDMIDLDKFGGIPLVGKPIAEIAQTFGISTSMAEFLTGQRGLLVQSVDALVKGIPSDFDVRNILATLPNASLAPGTNEIRKGRLNKIFKDIIINSVKFNLQMGKTIPHNYIDAAVAAGGDAVAADIRDLMRGGGDQGRMDYLNKIGVVQGFTTEGYIKEFGDPFQSSVDLINEFNKDGDKKRTLTPEEERELEEYRKTFKVN